MAAVKNKQKRLAEIVLNVAAYEPHSVVDGPGVRATLWVQGCSIRCPGCINAEFLPHREIRLIPVNKLAERIVQDQVIEGISFSGGEPFEQAQALAILCGLIRQKRPGLTFFSYSGFYLSELRKKNDLWVEKLLSHLDILVAGPFVLAQKGHLKWRGSSNKKIHFLTDRYSPSIFREKEPRTQFHFDAGGGTMHGFDLNGHHIKTFKKILAEKGIRLAIKKSHASGE